MRTHDLRRQNGRITAIAAHAGKGDKGRIVYATPQLSDKIMRWLDTRAALGVANGKVPIFCRIKSGAGLPVSARSVQELAGRLAREAGMERHVSPHTLRHTFATHLLRASGDLELTRKAPRHAQITATAALYSHLQPRDVDEAILALRDGAGRAPAQGQPAAPDLGAQIAPGTGDAGDRRGA